MSPVILSEIMNSGICSDLVQKLKNPGPYSIRKFSAKLAKVIHGIDLFYKADRNDKILDAQVVR
jgi:hypothetical protein